MRRMIVGFIALLPLAWAPSAHATTTINAPVASTSYGTTMPIDVNVFPAPSNNIRLEFTYTAGTQALSGDTWTVLLAGTALHTSFTMPTADPTASASVVSVTPSDLDAGTALPEGTYSVVLKFTPQMMGGPETSSPTTGVVIDRTTEAPGFFAPGTSSATTSPVPLLFYLPEDAKPGSLTVTFTRTGVTRVLTLASSQEGAGTHSFSIDPAAPLTADGVASIAPGASTIPDGTYDVTVAYRDALNNPTVTATHSGVTIDTGTSAPNLIAPTSGGTVGPDLPVSFQLHEAALSSSVKVTLTPTSGPASVVTLTGANETAATHAVTLHASDLTASASTLSVSGPTHLTDGTYAMTFEYRDALGNAAATATVTGFTFDLTTLAPTLNLPLATMYDTTTIPVSYTLAEIATAGTTVLHFVGDTVTADVTLTDTTAGTHTATLDRANLAASSGVSGVSGSTALPDGTYTVRLGTQDAWGNLSVQTAPRTVVLSSPVVDPDPTPTPDPAPSPTPDPIVGPTPPVVDGPLKVGVIKPKFGSKAVKVKNRRQLTATFKPWAGAKSYRFTAVIGATTKRGTCKTVGKNVVCSLNAPRTGVWKLTVSALAPNKTVLATGTGTKRVAFAKKR